MGGFVADHGQFHVRHEGAGGIAAVTRDSGEQLAQDETECEHVLLRSGISFLARRVAEVADLRFALLVEQDVGSADASMDHAVVMGMRQTLTGRDDDPGSLRGFDGLAAGADRGGRIGADPRGDFAAGRPVPPQPAASPSPKMRCTFCARNNGGWLVLFWTSDTYNSSN